MKRLLSLLTGLAFVLPSIAMAADEVTIDSGDTAWMIVASALVLFMTLPGLALFYGGLVRSKNVLSILMQCFAICAVMSLLWVIYGYSVAAQEGGRFWGGFEMAFLKHLTVDKVNGTIPESVYIMFQMTFAIITPALIVGAFAERIKFGAVMLFSIIWFSFSYLPIWHMAWGGGLFAEWDVIDFAGGTVVHINAAVAGLVGCMMVGKRRGAFREPIKPHNLPLTVVGAAMLWVGWFGFNAGSALAADGSAGMAMVVTHISAATASLVWMGIEWVKYGKPSLIGIVTGMVAGLATITPGAGFVGPAGALVFGIVAGFVCFWCVSFIKQKIHIDDSLDVFAVHGVGGALGILLTSFFGAEALGGLGLGEGMTMTKQLGVQVLGIVVVALWSLILSWIIVKVIQKTIGLRVNEEDEIEGLDITSHGERIHPN